MDSSGDENLSNKISLGDDFVHKPTEFNNGEQSSSRRTTDRLGQTPYSTKMSPVENQRCYRTADTSALIAIVPTRIGRRT